MRTGSSRCSKSQAAGFSLVELMTVIAVIAILALIAVPTFLDKIVKEQVVEALPLAKIVSGPVDSAWRASGALPANNAALGLPEPSKIVSNLVSSVQLEDGVIHIRFGNQANGYLKGKTLSLRPALVEDTPLVPIAWVCGYATEPQNMKVLGTNRTDVEKQYLPLRCL
jgi:type IV pilus assembly protein PilA